MRKAGRVVVLFLLSLVSAAALTAVTAVMAAVSLAATVALIVPGTGTPNANTVGDYRQNFRDYYMQNTPCTNNVNCPANDTNNPAAGGLYGINYPASFWPIPLPGWCPGLTCDQFDISVIKGATNLHSALMLLTPADQIIITGYSQGGRVASIAKMLYKNGAWADVPLPDGFVFIGNPNRPNGGLLSRLGFLNNIPILNVTTGQPTPTDLGVPTQDWAIRWEGIADWPTYLFNPLAVVNSILGFAYDHGTYLSINADSDPGDTPAGYTVDEWRDITSHPENHPQIVDIQQYGDTTYYTITPKVLPLVRPLHLIPFIGKPIADLFEPMLRVLIEETGYARGIPFGAPIGTGLIPFFNPITLFLKLIPALFVGINNFLANFGLTTEIPLSPTTPIPAATPPVSTMLADEQEQPEDNADDLSAARMSRVQDNGAQEEGGTEGEENQLLAQGETEGDLTVPEGTVPEGTLPEGTVPEQTPIEDTPIEPVEGQNGEHENEANQGDEVVGVLNKDPEGGKDPQENKDPEGNRVDANGGSVSLNFSPNKPADATKGGGEGAGETDPADNPDPAAPSEGTEGSEGSGQAAA
jgi:hypothetical protein